MATRVKIRGIYSSALTRLLMDAGYCMVDPSPQVQERLGHMGVAEEPEILIRDCQDLHSVDLIGEPEKLCPVLRLLQDRLLDAVLLRLDPLEEPEGQSRAQMAFPGSAKATLDEIRATVVPSLGRHHRFRITHPKGLDRAETHLLNHPESKWALERDLFHEAILAPLQQAGRAALTHVRISGRRVRPREGLIMEASENRILLKRSFSRGRYDGLDLPIEEGDYGLTEVWDGAWFLKHTYFSQSGRLKGEYFNINTPVEFYPDGARYVDLEVDVVRRAGEPPFTTDQEKLSILRKEGFIGAALERKALSVARGLMERLRS